MVVLGLISLFMGYQASQIQLSYDFAKVLPDDDPVYIEYENFKKMFGEDGNVMVIGFQDKNLFELNKFNDWYTLSNDIKNIQGVKELMSIAKLYTIRRNDSLSKFDFIQIVNHPLRSQQELDSIKTVITSLPFYEGLVYNKNTGANLMAITFTKKDLNSKHRIEMVHQIKALTDVFEKKYNLKLHYSGMPYIRTAFMEKISGEMGLFLGLAVLVMSFILWVFFRSFSAVFFSIIVVAIGVVWSLGTIHLFGYRITVLSGLVAPLIMVIGIPNCVFLINKYHSEFSAHGNKMKALTRMIKTIGVSLFLANITTAIGFGVLYFTNSIMLVEFGVVAAINVMATYAITLILIPIILSFLPVPSVKQTKHLEGKRINKILTSIDYLVLNKRSTI
ncbi:MAG: MMPL family transporter, partial [Bacteroidetes bacterium]|nr:MMPL family transporter [Bacteroidota bacterium]